VRRDPQPVYAEVLGRRPVEHRGSGDGPEGRVEVNVGVDVAQGRTLGCDPECTPRRHRSTITGGSWRHLDNMRSGTIVHERVPRMSAREHHGIKQWWVLVEPGSQFHGVVRALAIGLALQKASVSAVANHLRTDGDEA